MITRAAAPRRTQAQRTAATRAALVDATIGELFDHGYAGTTTAAVASRAWVSQGSVFRHFPTKEDLLVATLEHAVALAPDIVQGLMDATEDGADLRGRLRVRLQAVYDAFLTPPLVAVTEIQVAARTRPDLAARVTTVLGAAWLDIGSRAAPWFEDLADQPHFGPILGTVVDLIRGWALSRDTESDILALFPGAPDMLDLLTEMLVTTYGPDAPPNP